MASSPSRVVNKNVQYKSITEEQDETSLLSTGAGSSASYRPPQYRVYPWRWFMLFALCFLNVSNGMVSV